MTKQTALWLMIGGALASLYDFSTATVAGGGGDLYGVGKPLEKMRWKVYTDSAAKSYYVSASDAVAVTGAFFYFK